MLLLAVVILIQAVAGLVVPRDTLPQAFCSSSDRRYNLTTFAAPIAGNGKPGGSSTWKLTIDDTASGCKQRVTGFGAAVTDATIKVFNTLPTTTLSELLRELM